MANIGAAMTMTTPAIRVSDFMGATISPVVDGRGHHHPLRCRDAMARVDTSTADSVTRRCPACDADVNDNVTSSGFCRACGHDLVGTAPPPRWKRGKVDLRIVARRHRQALWATLAIVILNGLAIAIPLLTSSVGGGIGRAWLRFLPSQVATSFPILAIAAGVVAVVLVIRLTMAMRMHPLMIFIHALIALAPCVGVLSLMSACSQAMAMLRREGLKVGLLGTSEEELQRALAPNCCRNCGYTLARGAPQVQCPECGAPIERFAT